MRFIRVISMVLAFSGIFVGAARAVDTGDFHMPIALSIGQDGHGEIVGFGRDFKMEEAKKIALDRCNGEGWNCRIVATSNDGCLHAWVVRYFQTGKNVVVWDRTYDKVRRRIKEAKGLLFPDINDGPMHTCTSRKVDDNPSD